MQNSDVFLFPSLHDDSPLAISEAMACGLPVVCLERGGPPVLIGEAGGRAVSYRGSATRVSEVLAGCLNDELPDRTTVIAHASLLTIQSRAEQLRRLLENEGVLIGR
jgi:glycosyltransferase involved in cell wall biosynthesis